MMGDEGAGRTLAEGVAAARAGETDEALRLLRRATELEPDNVQAWIWRASVVEGIADKKSYLAQALALEPDNQEARLALERIEQREGELAQRAGEEPLHCTIHPDRETMLRCNRCGRAMCTECAVRHPVGLRCRECVSETRSPIYQVDRATTVRILGASSVVGTVVGTLSLLLGNLILAFGIFGIIIAFFIGGAVGRAIAAAVQQLVPRKRGRSVQTMVAAGIVVGVLLPSAAFVLLLQRFPNPLLVGIYLISVIPAAVASLR